MGAEISTVPVPYAEPSSGNGTSNGQSQSMKPNKVKKNNYFHSKPSPLVDLIVNKDWQSVINRCTSHPKEIYVTQKIRLYGVDRKILPLHIACAMRPPVEVISVLLRPDQISKMSTVKTPMKNAKKKTAKKSDKKGKAAAAGEVGVVPTMSYPQQLILSSPSASDKDEHSATNDSSPITYRTAPLSPGNVNDDTLHSSSHDQDDASSTSFFPDKENHYALQITPSGEVKQISPSGKSSRSRLGLASESPFVHASASRSEKGQPSFQSAMADDFFPIHIACLFRAAPEVIELLIKCYPEGLEKKNKWGMLPIHIVCSNLCLEPPSITAGKLAENFSTKDYLNNLYSESIDHSDKWEMVKVVEMLVASCPQSVNMPSDNIEWYTPSEYATRNLPRNDGTTEQIMNILKKKNKMSVAGISCDGHSISSSLSDSKASSDIKAFSISNCPLLYSYISTKQFLRSFDRVVKTPAEACYWVVDTAYPRLPIHLMCLNADAPQELAQALVDAYPEGCMAKEGSGSNPLHLACKNGLPLEIITTLLEKYPKATRMKDEMGRLPLHLACAVGADLAVIKALMDAYPASCSMKDYNGHTALTYVDYCMDDDSVKDEFTALFELYEDKLKRREKVSDPKTIVEEEQGDGDGDYRQLQVE